MVALMAVDLPSTLIAATVEVEQALPDGRRIIGTGFLISDPTPDGRPRTVLVTANHVLNRMPGTEAHIGYRLQGKDGGWIFDPQPVSIRRNGHELWTHHPSRDVAVLSVKAPPAFTQAAIPLAWLAGGDTFSRYGVGPGDEMMVLGYPQGLSANAAGFPILRSGRVASPIDPPQVSPTFLLDFRVFPGNSGGPVFMAAPARDVPGQGAPEPAQFIAGLLTQQVELNNERLEIGIVTEASFIRETLGLLDKVKLPAEQAEPASEAAQPASATQQPATPQPRSRAIVGTAVSE